MILIYFINISIKSFYVVAFQLIPAGLVGIRFLSSTEHYKIANLYNVNLNKLMARAAKC